MGTTAVADRRRRPRRELQRPFPIRPGQRRAEANRPRGRSAWRREPQLRGRRCGPQPSVTTSSGTRSSREDRRAGSAPAARGPPAARVGAAEHAEHDCAEAGSQTRAYSPTWPRRAHFRDFNRRHWKPVQKTIGIEPLRDLYDLRHTHAAFALRARVPVFALSRFTGTSITMIDLHNGTRGRQLPARRLAPGRACLEPAGVRVWFARVVRFSDNGWGLQQPKLAGS
jgi:hypothetical protein